MAAQSQWLRRRAVASRRESRGVGTSISWISEWVIGCHNWRPTGPPDGKFLLMFPTGILLAPYWPSFFDPWPFWVWVFGGSLNVCVYVCFFFWMVVYVRLPGHHLPIVRSCVDQLINPNEYQWIPVLGFVWDAAKWFTYVYLPLDQWGMWWYVSGMCIVIMYYNVLSCCYIHVISMFNMIWNLVVGTYWSLQSTMTIWIMYIIVHLQSIIYIYIHNII